MQKVPIPWDSRPCHRGFGGSLGQLTGWAILLWEQKSFPSPLVNVYITMERSTILFMGKSTMSIAMFNSKLFVYQAGYPHLFLETHICCFVSHALLHEFSVHALPEQHHSIIQNIRQNCAPNISWFINPANYRYIWVNFQYFTNLNSSAIKGDDSPISKPWFQVSGEQWGRDEIYADISS